MSNPFESDSIDPKRELLRHTLATLAYRGGKAVRNAPWVSPMFHADEGCARRGKFWRTLATCWIGPSRWRMEKRMA